MTELQISVEMLNAERSFLDILAGITYDQFI